MKRRGFLGLLGGAAVAGPSVAKAAIADAAPLMGGDLAATLSMHTLNGGYADATNATSSRGILGTFERIKTLNRFLAGEDNPEPDPYDISRRRQVMAEHRLMSLGSISQASRMNMLAKEIDRICRERDRGYWMRELKELMAGER